MVREDGSRLLQDDLPIEEGAADVRGERVAQRALHLGAALVALVALCHVARARAAERVAARPQQVRHRHRAEADRAREVDGDALVGVLGAAVAAAQRGELLDERPVRLLQPHVLPERRVQHLERRRLARLLRLGLRRRVLRLVGRAAAASAASHQPPPRHERGGAPDVADDHRRRDGLRAAALVLNLVAICTRSLRTAPLPPSPHVLVGGGAATFADGGAAAFVDGAEALVPQQPPRPRLLGNLLAALLRRRRRLVAAGRRLQPRLQRRIQLRRQLVDLLADGALLDTQRPRLVLRVAQPLLRRGAGEPLGPLRVDLAQLLQHRLELLARFEQLGLGLALANGPLATQLGQLGAHLPQLLLQRRHLALVGHRHLERPCGAVELLAQLRHAQVEPLSHRVQLSAPLGRQRLLLPRCLLLLHRHAALHLRQQRLALLGNVSLVLRHGHHERAMRLGLHRPRRPSAVGKGLDDMLTWHGRRVGRSSSAS